MTVGRQQRRNARAPKIRNAFGTEADQVLDLLEIVELCWHDCYGEVSSPDPVIDDILVCANGNLRGLVRAARLAIEDSRDLRLWADDVRRGRPD